MTPIPTVASFEELNTLLAERFRARQGERAGRHASTIGERLVADLAALRALPAVPLEPCEKRVARVSSTALVRYRIGRGPSTQWIADRPVRLSCRGRV